MSWWSIPAVQAWCMYSVIVMYNRAPPFRLMSGWTLICRIIWSFKNCLFVLIIVQFLTDQIGSYMALSNCYWWCPAGHPRLRIRSCGSNRSDLVSKAYSHAPPNFFAWIRIASRKMLSLMLSIDDLMLMFMSSPVWAMAVFICSSSHAWCIRYDSYQ